MGWLTIGSAVVLEEAAAAFGKYRVCSYFGILLIKITKFFKYS
jgi:hypothetical protein